MLQRPSFLRSVASSTLSQFEWVHGANSWHYTYTRIAPSDESARKGTLVLYPSCTLLSTNEEWREAAELLSSVGYNCLLFDWPGWHSRNAPLNWAIEDDVRNKTVISTMTHFAYESLKHVESECGPVHVVTSGGLGGVHLRRALMELLKESTNFKSLTCFSPSWRFYLTRSVPEGYPRKLSRRRALADWFLDTCFVRSRTMYRIYRSKLGLSKMTRRLYEDKIQHNPDLLEQKREVIIRDRPLAIDAAMISGHFDPVSSTQELIHELLGADTKTSQDHNDDSDDDDSLLNIKVPNWVKSEKSQNTTATELETNKKELKVNLVFPQDVSGVDKRELDTIREWAKNTKNVSVSVIPGKLFCHEENPALSASAIEQFVSNQE